MSASSDIRKSELFLRFTVSERIEHIILLIAFGMLALTGLVQKFNQAGLAEGIIQVMGGIEGTRLIHRGFALVMAVISLYHIIKLTYRFSRRQIRPTMLPTPKDARDALQMVQYYLGLRAERPLFDRYDFRQKFEYWALVWGNVMMGLTGFAMWFPYATTSFLPGEVIPAAKAAHGAEAILAVLAIFIWHMYSAHLNADVFPMDKSIIFGTIDQERMIHEHPLEYARIMEEAKLAEEQRLAAAKAAAPAAPPEAKA